MCRGEADLVKNGCGRLTRRGSDVIGKEEGDAREMAEGRGRELVVVRLEFLK